MRFSLLFALLLLAFSTASPLLTKDLRWRPQPRINDDTAMLPEGLERLLQKKEHLVKQVSKAQLSSMRTRYPDPDRKPANNLMKYIYDKQRQRFENSVWDIQPKTQALKKVREDIQAVKKKLSQASEEEPISRPEPRLHLFSPAATHTPSSRSMKKASHAKENDN